MTTGERSNRKELEDTGSGNATSDEESVRKDNSTAAKAVSTGEEPGSSSRSTTEGNKSGSPDRGGFESRAAEDNGPQSPQGGSGGVTIELEGDPYDREGQFVEEADDKDAFWNRLDVMQKPLTVEEKEIVMRKLPRPIARFLIRRAEGSEKGDRKGWLDAFVDDDPQYGDEDYIKDSDLKRKSDLDEMEDGNVMYPDQIVSEKDLLTKEEEEEKRREDRRRSGGQSLFIDPKSIGKQKIEEIGLSVFALIFLFAGFKVFFSVLTFFIAFSYKFLIIFVVSAGIFVGFYLLQF